MAAPIDTAELVAATSMMPNEATRRRLAVTFNTIGAVATCLFGLLGLAFSLWETPVYAVILLAMSLALSLSVVALRQGLALGTAASIAGSIVLVGVSSLAFLTPSFPSHVLVWLASLPLAAVLLGRYVPAMVWTLASFGVVWSVYAKVRLGADGAEPSLIQPLSIVGLILVSLALARISDDIRTAMVRRNARLQGQLAHAHQLHNMGEIAGAIAHDFNNLLTVIQSYAGLMLDELGEGEPQSSDLREILSACERATELTAGLRTFAQNQPSQPEPVDLANLSRDLEPLLRSIVGERIEVMVDVAPSLGPVRVDRAQLERVIANLALNARDAMPEGGRLSLVGDIAYVSGVDVAMGLVEGPYARLSVRDNGVGMTADVASRVFEPFFTTKRRGQGTGLGLSTAYGTVRAAGGDLRLNSTPSRGTTFEILLPIVDGPPAPAPSTETPPADVDGSETILVVDDQPALARSVKRLLETGGYRVLTATSFQQALAVLEEHHDAIDLALVDVVMPDRTGPELAAELDVRKPGLAVVFMSGYTGDSLPFELNNGSGRLLKKPFNRLQVMQAIRRALDEARR